MKLLQRALRRIRSSEDSGSALILALLVVLVVGTLLAVALDFTGTGLTLAPNVRNQRNESNYVQGAVEGAINQIRGSSEAGRTDGVISCPDFAPAVPGGVTGVTGKTFRVTCTAQSTGSTSSDDQPRYAIHALGSGSTGIRHVAGNYELYINGGIYSNGVVGVTGGGSSNSFRVNGTVTAEGSCTSGKVTSTDGLGLNCSAASSAAGDDPNYASSVPDAASLASLINTGVVTTGADPVPTCGTGRITFEPGYYGTRPDLLVTKLASSCSGNTLWHFKPGRYYFDYSGVWDLASRKVVGGTLSGTPTVLSEACTETSEGVQFVFGGASQIFTSTNASLNAEGIELCGPTSGHTLNGGPQRIVLYGVKTGAAPTATPTTLRATADPTPSLTWISSDLSITPGAAARVDDADSATTVLTAGGTATMSYGILPSTPAIPKGAKVSAVTLKVAHSLQRATAVVKFQIGSAPAISVDANTSVSILNNLTTDVLWRLLTQSTVTFEATGNSGSQAKSATLDGLEIDVTYTAPTLTQLQCAGSCAFFDSGVNSNVTMHGTVYTPTADWRVEVHNAGETIFNRGVVVRDIAITMSTSSKQTDSPFQIPQGTPTGRLVLFRGYVDGVEKVRACARYADFVTSGSTTSAYAGWSLTVPRWLVMRSPSAQAATCG